MLSSYFSITLFNLHTRSMGRRIRKYELMFPKHLMFRKAKNRVGGVRLFTLCRAHIKKALHQKGLLLYLTYIIIFMASI